MLIHIGLPKAASTFIQCAAHQRGDVRVLQWNTYANRVVAAASIAAYGNCPATVLETAPLPGAGAEGHTFVTCEQLIGWAPVSPTRSQIALYQKLVADHLAADWPGSKVLLVTRRPASFFDSYYSQVVKEGETKSPRKYAECWRDFLVALVAYDEIRRLYARRFGQDRVLLLPIELLADDRDRFYDLLESFCGFVLRPRSPEGIPRNRKLTPIETKVGRVINRAAQLMVRKSAPEAGVAEFHSIKRQFISRYLENADRSEILTRRLFNRFSVVPDRVSVSDVIASEQAQLIADNMAELAESPQPHRYFIDYYNELVGLRQCDPRE